jgi:hypothetical protein
LKYPTSNAHYIHYIDGHLEFGKIQWYTKPLDPSNPKYLPEEIEK